MKIRVVEKRLRKGSRCPSCANGRLLPIVYGLPLPESLVRDQRGEVILGGCIVTKVFDPELGFISDPELGCPACERKFYRNGRASTEHQSTR